MEDAGTLVTTFEVPTMSFHDGCHFRRAASVFTVPGVEEEELANAFIAEQAARNLTTVIVRISIAPTMRRHGHESYIPTQTARNES